MNTPWWAVPLLIFINQTCLATKHASYPYFCGSDAPRFAAARAAHPRGGFVHRYVDGASLEGEVVRERIQIGPFYGNLTFGLVNDTSGTPYGSRVASR